MKHAHRCTHWNRPKNQDAWDNSLHDAFMKTQPGGMLVYRNDLPGTITGKPAPENRIAQKVAERLGGVLVQWPSEPCNGDQKVTRKWLYAIQKRSNAVAA